MVTYVGLMSFTDKGIQGIKDTTKRAAAAREVAKKFGVNFREILWTMGKYDLSACWRPKTSKPWRLSI